jgi:hypothetical protein
MMDTKRISVRKKMAKRYIVNDGKLFKRGNSGILLRCLSGDEAMEVMHQSHVTCWHLGGAPRRAKAVSIFAAKKKEK